MHKFNDFQLKKKTITFLGNYRSISFFPIFLFYDSIKYFVYERYTFVRSKVLHIISNFDNIACLKFCSTVLPEVERPSTKTSGRTHQLHIWSIHIEAQEQGERC